MSDIVISAQGVSKLYRLGARERYRTLRDSVTETLTAPFRKRREQKTNESPESFWALKDICFDIRQGDVIGIIGRNGAGKSTLLKILSRITEPTLGEVRISGRIASLLEVGTGFHPELSGRDNIYLNGAILGMKKDEIRAKFDEIVAFAEVDKFIDTPVKHYSSGMYVRLAFAVAAHLEPEILIVDEVLAVGDAAFQKKCLGRMNEVARQGRTVLFVSHNLVAVENLCSSGIVLNEGRLMFHGGTRKAVEAYLSAGEGKTSQNLEATKRQAGTGEARITEYELIASGGSLVRAGESFTIRFHFRCSQRIKNPCFNVSILTRSGLHLFSIYTSDLDYQIPEISSDGYIDLQMHSPNLLPGTYVLHFGIADERTNHWYDLVTENAEFNVEPADVYGTGRQRGSSYSLLFYSCDWSLNLTAGREETCLPSLVRNG